MNNALFLKITASARRSRNPVTTALGVVIGYLVANRIGSHEIVAWIAAQDIYSVVDNCFGVLAYCLGYKAYNPEPINLTDEVK